MHLSRLPAIASLVAGLVAGHMAEAAESRYTDLMLDKCKALVESDPDEPGGKAGDPMNFHGDQP